MVRFNVVTDYSLSSLSCSVYIVSSFFIGEILILILEKSEGISLVLFEQLERVDIIA